MTCGDQEWIIEKFRWDGKKGKNHRLELGELWLEVAHLVGRVENLELERPAKPSPPRLTNTSPTIIPSSLGN